MSNKEIIYENPPLIEVIVELRWKVQNIEALPGAAIDPHFEEFREKFTIFAKENGYKTHERINDGIPIELVSGRPTDRFRKYKNKWPLFQIGPGLLTINAVPPYGGWTNLKEMIELAIIGLWQNYPHSDEYLRINKLELKYLNGFDEEWGYSKHNKFLQDELSCTIKINDAIIKKYVSEPEQSMSFFQYNFVLNKNKGSCGIIKVSPGQKRGKDAAILELIVQKNDVINRSKKIDWVSESKSINNWFDNAHEVISFCFNAMISDNVKKNMGEII